MTLAGCRKLRSIGVEVEGHWPRFDPDGDHQDRPEMFKFDGSVHATRDDEYSGEIASPVFAGDHALADLRLWIKDAHPARVDHRCGLHFHVGMEDPIWHRLCYGFSLNARVAESMLAVSGLHPTTRRWLVERVARGSSTPTGSQWCRIRSLWDEYSESIHDDRYRRINPCSYDTWGTLEIRLAPMVRDAGESEAMILAGMHAVDRWIAGGGTPASATVTAPPIKGGIHRLGGSRPTRTATGSGTLQIRTHGDLDDDDR